MTAHLTERARRELAALEVAIWGDLDATIDAVEDATLDPEQFLDPTRRTVAEIIVALVLDAEPPFPSTIHERLLALGWRREAASDAVLNRGGFEVAGCRLDGLGPRLVLLAEQGRREAVQNRLVALATRLDTPGGVDRVADVLGVVA